MTSSDVPAHLDLLPLSAAPRPSSGAELADRLRTAVASALGNGVQFLERARIDAVLDNADITSLDLDLTHVVVTASQSLDGVAPWNPVVRSRQEAHVGRLRLDAHPMTAVDLPVDIAAEVQGLRFAWVEGTDGLVGIQPLEPDHDTPLTGHARVSVDKDGLVGTARGLLAVPLASQGLQLVSFDLDVTQHGPRGASLVIDATIRKGFLSARARATASASIDDHLVLTVGDVTVSSGNPFVNALLAAVRGRIEAASRQRIDLAAALPPGVRLTDVRLDVGQQIVISTRLG